MIMRVFGEDMFRAFGPSHRLWSPQLQRRYSKIKGVAKQGAPDDTQTLTPARSRRTRGTVRRGFRTRRALHHRCGTEPRGVATYSYRQAMMTSNGGQVSAHDDVWDLHPALDTSDRKRLKRSCNDILHDTEYMLDWPGWPKNALALGSNSDGDRLVLLKVE